MSQGDAKKTSILTDKDGIPISNNVQNTQNAILVNDEHVIRLLSDICSKLDILIEIIGR